MEDLRRRQRRILQSLADTEVCEGGKWDVERSEDVGGGERGAADGVWDGERAAAGGGFGRFLSGQKRRAFEAAKKELQSEMDIREGRKREKERRACVARLQELFPDVRGLLLDLCNPTQKKYSMAVETALGKHLDAVVVKSKTVAIECIQWVWRLRVSSRFLKEQHMPPMDFYPLDSLKPKELRSELRQLNCKLCYELLEFDSGETSGRGGGEEQDGGDRVHSVGVASACEL